MQQVIEFYQFTKLTNVETKSLQKTCLPPFAAVRYHNPTGIDFLLESKGERLFRRLRLSTNVCMKY